MDLHQWLSETGTTQRELATQMGVSIALVAQWLRGDTKLTDAKAKRLEAVTSGLVRVETTFPGVIWHRDAKGRPTAYTKTVGA